MTARWRHLWRVWRQRRRFEGEIDAELNFHLQARADQLQSTGVDRPEALRRARIELGMVNVHRDGIRAAVGLQGLDRWQSDLRQAWRSLRRSPVYASVAVLVLALPLATGLLLHGLYAAYALQSPALDRVDRWVHLHGVSAADPQLNRFTVSETDALLAQPPAALEGLYSARLLTLPIVTDRIRRGIGIAVSDNYFELTGVPALRGRVFRSDESSVDGVVLSERGWQRLFDRDENVLGRTLSIGGHAVQVIGVAGRDFRGTQEVGAHYWLREADARRYWPDPDGQQRTHTISGFVVPAAGLESLAQALSARLTALPGTTLPGDALQHVGVEAGRGYLRADDRRELQLALTPAAILVLLMLLIAAANLTNLVLARFSARRHDVALRCALGASRWRSFAHLLTECALLGGLAALLALLLLAAALRPLHGWLFGVMAEMGLDPIEITLGPTSVLLAALLAMLGTLVFGALPAWLVTRNAADPRGRGGLQQGLKRHGRQRLQGILMVLQLAASVFLMVVAAMIGGVSRQVEQAPLGFDPEGLVSMDAAAMGPARIQALRQLPQVTALAATSAIPLMRNLPLISVGDATRSEAFRVRWVDPDWFELMGQRPLAGRLFAPSDGNRPIAILSQSAAQRLPSPQAVLGQRLQLSDATGELDLPATVEVMAVVPDLASGLLIGGHAPPTLYLPGRVDSPQLDTLLLRLSDSSPQALAQLYQRCVDASGGEAGGCQPLRLTEALRLQQLPLRLASSLTAALGWIGLAISCIGLHGLVSYTIVQRRRQIGIQMALGATAGRVVRTVLRGALRQILVGLAVGLPVSWLLAALIAHYTSIVGATDARSLLLTPMLLLLVALLAAWWPARRSADIEPAEVLRSEA
ncbi:MAG: ABC transporter permease [Xanthomonadales bacterium]|nr:ABC transporter permease [Xanthomonadales bacterium]